MGSGIYIIWPPFAPKIPKIPHFSTINQKNIGEMGSFPQVIHNHCIKSSDFLMGVRKGILVYRIIRIEYPQALDK